MESTDGPPSPTEGERGKGKAGVGRRSLLRLELEPAEVEGLPGRDLDRLAFRVLRGPEPGLVPDDDVALARRGVLDLEVAVLVGHGEVGVVEDAHVALHPAVHGAVDQDRVRGRL